jgi:hypothetical protein
MLGFIKRTSHDFNNPICLKVLYCLLVRSSFEFGTVLWNPNQLQFISKLEKVQRNFLRFYAYKIMRLNQNIDEIANFAGLKSLKTRRLVFDATFVYKILNGEIDCPELLQKFLKYPLSILDITLLLLYNSQKQITFLIVRCVVYQCYAININILIFFFLILAPR